MAKNAIQQALAELENPASLDLWRRTELPNDILTLIKIAAGDQETLDATEADFGKDHGKLITASRLYLRKMITTAGANAGRKLGVSAATTPEQIRQHKRWLLKWLHPDRNTSSWETSLFNEVSRAAAALESSDQIAWQKDKSPESAKPKSAVFAARTNPVHSRGTSLQFHYARMRHLQNRFQVMQQPNRRNAFSRVLRSILRPKRLITVLILILLCFGIWYAFPNNFNPGLFGFN